MEGPATDVYALALITAYMLSGRVLFADPDVKAHFDDRISGDAFARERLAALEIDERIQRVLSRAITADPLTRTASPSEFFEEMQGALSVAPPADEPPSRRSLESITLVVEPMAMDAEPIAPPERETMVGGRGVRIVEITDKLDFTLHGPHPNGDPNATLRPVRFRIALLPAPGPEGFAVHIKGLNCFVVRARTNPRRSVGASRPIAQRPPRPTPAITASEAGEAELVSGEQETLAQIRWSFGRASDVGEGAGRVFDIGLAELVIPFSQASQAVAIDLGPEREAIVVCKRA
jgi:hypothetical protein